MQEHFLTYEQSLAVKKLGFDEPCLGYWNIDPYLPKPTFNLVKPFDHEWCVPAPLKSQFFRWVREKYQIYSHIERIGANNTFEYWIKNKSKAFDTYEQAEDACINKIIELLKLK